MSYSQYQTDISIAVGVMSGLALIYAGLRTWSWFRRTGRLAIDFLSVVKSLAFSCGYVANAIFVAILGAAIWWEFFYKVSTNRIDSYHNMWTITRRKLS